MNSTKLVERLVEHFGDRVKVRSQYHIQVESTKGPHDIWLNKHCEIKFKIAGNRNIDDAASLDAIIKRIEQCTSTHFDQMREMLDLAKFVNKSERDARQLGAAVIFTDAGFKDGKARIAAVFVNGDDIEAKSKLIDADSIMIAETRAVELGAAMHDTAPIYCDNQGVVSAFNSDRIRWLSRKDNKAADSIGNMRKPI